jgi:predicted negative regulator of RcsB-dependent stress response
VGDTLGHLGDTCHAAGRPEEARTFWEAALAILEDLHAAEADQIRAKLRDLSAGL